MSLNRPTAHALSAWCATAVMTLPAAGRPVVGSAVADRQKQSVAGPIRTGSQSGTATTIVCDDNSGDPNETCANKYSILGTCGLGGSGVDTIPRWLAAFDINFHTSDFIGTGQYEVRRAVLLGNAGWGQTLPNGFSCGSPNGPTGLYWPYRDQYDFPSPNDGPQPQANSVGGAFVLDEFGFGQFASPIAGRARGGPLESDPYYNPFLSSCGVANPLGRGIFGNGVGAPATLLAVKMRATGFVQRPISVRHSGTFRFLVQNPTTLAYSHETVSISSPNQIFVLPGPNEPYDFAAINGLADLDSNEYPDRPSSSFIQNTATSAGDNTIGVDMVAANGSEIDGVFGKIACLAADVGPGCQAKLRLFVAGNLSRTPRHRLHIFIDSVPGAGQNRLVSPLTIGNLNRLSAGPGGPGLTFEPGFAADYWIGAVATTANPSQLEVSIAELPTAGSGRGWNCGTIAAAQMLTGDGVLSQGDVGAPPLRAAICNANTAGIPGGTGPVDPNAMAGAASIVSGVEFEIPLAAIGNPGRGVRLCVLISNELSSFVFNQVIPGVGGRNSLGEPRSVDFALVNGLQYLELLPSNPPPARYRITDLGTLGAAPALPHAMNPGTSGNTAVEHIAGESARSSASANTFAFRRSIVAGSPTMQDLGTLAGAVGGSPLSAAYGVDNSGVAVGRSRAADGQYRAFRTAPNGTALIDLGSFFSATSTVAHGIAPRDAGGTSMPITIAGTMNTPSGEFGFLWSSASDGMPCASPECQTLAGGSVVRRIRQLTVFDVASRAVGVNNYRQVAGTSDAAFMGSTASYAWVWQGGVVTQVSSLPGAQFAFASAISSPDIAGRESIVGASESTNGAGGTPFDGGAPRYHGFVARRAAGGTTGGYTTYDLGTLPGGTFSVATSSNGTASGAVGGVVGTSDIGGTLHAVFWPQSGGIIDLRSLVLSGQLQSQSWTDLSSASAIDNRGRIVGYGNRAGFASSRAFLLEPVATCPADFNESGAVSVQDIFDFLSAYFSGNFTADFNQNGAVSVQDIFDYLAAYFAGCV